MLAMLGSYSGVTVPNSNLCNMVSADSFLS